VPFEVALAAVKFATGPVPDATAKYEAGSACQVTTASGGNVPVNVYALLVPEQTKFEVDVICGVA
jgi:hypothetical protein